MQERIFLFSLPLQVATVALAVKNPPANAGVMRHEFDPRVGNIPWRRDGNLVQYSCLQNPVDRGAWRTIVHRVAKSRTQLK